MSHDQGRSAPIAGFRAATGRGLSAVSDDVSVLDGSGRWAVAIDFEGRATLARFDNWRDGPPRPEEIGSWHGPARDRWRDSMGRAAYLEGVARIRDRIAAGDVYQVNLCRRLSADLPDRRRADAVALNARLAAGNPAPFAGVLRLPGLSVVSASPELFLQRSHDVLLSGPIKGTATSAAELTAKDEAENVMIVDLVRNDLARVCRPGSVEVPGLLRVETHPGLVHLVSYVSGVLCAGVSWVEILASLFPPGSVSGTPKLAALDVIRELEPVDRGPYCGAFGWVDADEGSAELAVAIRSFWLKDGQIHFGTGAGITWGSDPEQEWRETELKARRLVGLATTDRSALESL